MIPANAEARRGLRSIVRGIADLLALCFVGWLIYLLANESAALLQICMALLAINLLSTIGYIAENGIRSFKLTGPGDVSAEFTTGDPPPASPDS